MPCRDYDEDRTSPDTREIERLKKRNDELARHVCIFATAFEYACHVGALDVEKTLVRANGVNKGHVPAAFAFWTKHKKADAIEQEKLELKTKGKALLKKMSAEDKAALIAAGVRIDGAK